MKLQGMRPEPPEAEIAVIPRDTGDLVFKCKPVFDFTDFEKACPMPKPPLVTYRGGEKMQDIDDPKFRSKLEERGRRRMAWMIIKSLEDTEGLEWELVDPKNPKTWEKIFDELKEAYLSPSEINYIIGKVQEACRMDEDRLEEARRRFIRTQQEQNAK